MQRYGDFGTPTIPYACYTVYHTRGIFKNLLSKCGVCREKYVSLPHVYLKFYDMKVISTISAPGAIGPYSQAIQVGNLVYTSGQIPINPATGAFPDGGIQAQARQSLNNVRAILEEAGLSMNNVVKTTVFLADMNDFAKVNSIYAEFFSEPYPARSAVAVKTLPKGALIEIEVVACK